MQHDDLYREVIRDLRGRLSDRSAYNIVKSSGLVRQLLLDGTALVSLVNRQHHLKLVFRAMADAALPIEAPILHFRNPAGIPNAPALTDLSLDRFLALNCGQFHGSKFTVKDLVRYGAHVLGGVHQGAPRDPADKVILEMDKALETGEITLSLRALEGIGNVTLQGLDPLSKAVGGI